MPAPELSESDNSSINNEKLGYPGRVALVKHRRVDSRIMGWGEALAVE
jgi:hypothetical protein